MASLTPSEREEYPLFCIISSNFPRRFSGNDMPILIKSCSIRIAKANRIILSNKSIGSRLGDTCIFKDGKTRAELDPYELLVWHAKTLRMDVDHKSALMHAKYAKMECWDRLRNSTRITYYKWFS